MNTKLSSGLTTLKMTAVFIEVFKMIRLPTTIFIKRKPSLSLQGTFITIKIIDYFRLITPHSEQQQAIKSVLAFI